MPNLINPRTGEASNVSDGDADTLRRAGWTDETTAGGASRVIGEREKDYYTGTGQELKAAGEGLISGASLGLSDLVFDDEDARKRAEYNPGIRTGTELLGGLVPALVTGGGTEAATGLEEGGGVLRSLANLTPAGRLGSVSNDIREGIGGLRGAAVAGGIEGAAFGAGGALSHAQLSDDPMTLESFVGSAGIGLLIGAGAGLIGGGLVRGGQVSEESLAADRAEAALTARSPELQALAATSRDVSKAAQEQLRAVSATLKDANKAAMAEESATRGFNPRSALDAIKGAENEVVTRAGVSGGPEMSAVVDKLRGAFRKASAVAATDKDIGRVYAAVQQYHELVGSEAGALGVKMPAIPDRVGTTLRAEAEATGKRYADSMREMSTLPSALKLAPTSPSELAAMGNARAGQYFDGLRTVLTTKSPELQALQLQVKEQVEQVLSANNIVLPQGTSPVEGLEALRQSLRTSKAALPAEVAGKAPEGKGAIGWLKKSARRAAANYGTKMGDMTGLGTAGRAAGREAGWLGMGALLGMHHPVAAGALIAESLGMRGAVTQATREMMAKLGRPMGMGAMRVGPVAARLATSLTGARDNSKDVRDLALNRANEARQLASGAHRDLLYSAVQPIAAHSLAFARGLVDLSARAVEYLAAHAPRDPGGGGAHVFGAWERGWKPSRVQALEYAAVHEAVTAPMDGLQRLVSGNFEPAAADALWAVYPTIMQRAAAEMIYSLSGPRAPAIPLGRRASLSIALRVPLDGLMRPEAISALQMAYVPPDPKAVGSGDMSTSSPRGRGRPAATEQTKVEQLES